MMILFELNPKMGPMQLIQTAKMKQRQQHPKVSIFLLFKLLFFFFSENISNFDLLNLFLKEEIRGKIRGNDDMDLPNKIPRQQQQQPPHGKKLRNYGEKVLATQGPQVAVPVYKGWLVVRIAALLIQLHHIAIVVKRLSEKWFSVTIQK